MESLTREAILRMVGLHDAAHMMRQLNAIQLSMEEEQGRMVTYWTEIRKSEKEVTLLAGRMTDAETDIGQLQVTAQQITASVSSLTTTVNGHTTSIGQLTITANQLTASVSTISDTVNGHTTSIGQLQITSNNLTASVSSISDTVNGHTTSIGQLEIKSDRISNRVTVIEGDYVKEAEISLMVVKDGNGYISNASIKADNIDFTFTRNANFISNGTTVMSIDTGGNLWIAGQYQNGLRVNNNGIERWNDSKDAWSELYASRCVKIISSATVTLNKDDDFIVSVSPNSRINLPTGNSNGKNITIKTIGHTTNIQPQSGYQIYTDHSIPYGGSGIDLNNYDRAEFVLYNNVWYWNAISI